MFNIMVVQKPCTPLGILQHIKEAKVTNQCMLPIGTPVVVNIQGSLVHGFVYNHYTVGDITDYAIQIREDFVIGEIKAFRRVTVRVPQPLVYKKVI